MAGVVIAAFLAAGVLVFALIGGIGADLALRRGARAGLLVLVATWLRSAAGSEGLREVSRRALSRLRRLPSVPEASRVLDELGSGRQLGTAARSVARGAARRRSQARCGSRRGARLGGDGGCALPGDAARSRRPPGACERVTRLLVALAAAPLAAIVAV